MDWLIGLLNSPNAPLALCIILLVFFVCVTLSRRGLLGIHTKYVTIGATSREDTIKDNQMENAYLFIMGLEAVIICDNSKYNGYKTKWILERMYDEVVTWIMHNHIRRDEVYVRQKCDKVRSLLYNLGVIDDFKTPEFAEKMNQWTKELINRLIDVRAVYEQGGGMP